jgi:hypothetical protein
LTGIAALFGNVPKLASVEWLAIFLVTTFSGVMIWGAGELVLLLRQRRVTAAVSPTNLSEIMPAPKRETPSPTQEKHRSVEFWLPSNWGPGFRRRSIGNENGYETAAEEVHLLVRATEKMQDVSFEIVAKGVRGVSPREELAKIGSNIFSGTVQKGKEQRFVVMRRQFWLVPTSIKHPALGRESRESSEQMRVEKGVMFFPENPAAFEGRIGDSYYFAVNVLHDHGPDNAHFIIELRDRQTFAQSLVIGRSNIEPYMGD